MTRVWEAFASIAADRADRNTFDTVQPASEAHFAEPELNMPHMEESSSRGRFAAYIAVCLPLVMLLAACLWLARADLNRVRTESLRDEMIQLRAQAVRRAGRLEFLLERQNALARRWAELREEKWLNDFWSGIELAPHQPYAAVVDVSGTIVLHTDASRVGKRLGRDWYERRVSEAGNDIVKLDSLPLADEQGAFDVTVPLTVSEEWLGDYHEGLDAQWFASDIRQRQANIFWKWAWLVLGVLVLDAAAAGALIYFARGERSLRHSLRHGVEERGRELAQLSTGLAHEIRNPLHSLRINLHLLRRALAGRSALNDSQLVQTIEDSDGAIDRLGGLMQDLVRFADPQHGKPAAIDLSREVQATLNLLSEDLRRAEIELRANLSQENVNVYIDPARLRQLVLNLLTFVQNKTGKRGSIDVEVRHQGGEVELALSDSGPPLSEEQRTRLFEPFQAPAETGSGLGLALVQVYAEEAGGRVVCQPRPSGGNRVCLLLPRIPSSPTGGKL